MTVEHIYFNLQQYQRHVFLKVSKKISLSSFSTQTVISKNLRNSVYICDIKKRLYEALKNSFEEKL